MRRSLISPLIVFTVLIFSAVSVSNGSAGPSDIIINQNPVPPSGPPVAVPGVPTNVTMGSPIAVEANSSVQLVTPSGISINVTPSAGVEITINESSVNPAGMLNDKLVSLGIYLSIEMNDTSVDVNSTISIPYNSSMVEGMNETALEFRFYNTSTGIWEAVPSWVDIENKVVYGNTTHFSDWTVTSESINQTPPPNPPGGPPAAVPGVPNNVTMGSPIAIHGNSSVQLVTPSGISINVTPSAGVEITINESSVNPAGMLNDKLVSLGIYLSIEMNDTSVDVNSTISIPYNSSMVEGMNETALEFRFYNTSTGIWEAVPSWVDIENKVVYGNTTHFSDWTVTSETVDQVTQPPVQVGPPVAVPGVPYKVTPGSPVAISGRDRVELVTPSGISISLVPGKSIEITINEFTSNPAGAMNKGLTSLGLYLTIEANETNVDINATLSLPFSDEDLSGIDVNTLEFRFYNDITQAWESVPSWVDLTAKIVYGNTTHFSTWTITGSETSVDTSDTTSESSTNQVETTSSSDETTKENAGLNQFFTLIPAMIVLIAIKKLKIFIKVNNH